MRRLHILIDLPPSTDEVLRKAYAPANDHEWMIPFENDVTVELVATIIQAHYRSRYPDFNQEAPLNIRKISDGYGMVPDRSSRVRDIWEERRVGLAPEEYTAHATRGDFTAKEIAMLQTIVEGGREFSMAPESSARIRKRAHPHSGHGYRFAGTSQSADPRQASKRRRIDAVPMASVERDESPHSVELVGQAQRDISPGRTGHVAIDDSQLSQSRGDAGHATSDIPPKSESPEASPQPFHSAPVSQLDTPESSSREFESAGETSTADTTDDLADVSESQPIDQDEEANVPPGAQSHPDPLPPPTESQSVFDIPEDEPYQPILSRTHSSTSGEGQNASSAASLLTLNRKTGQDQDAKDGAPQRPLPNTNAASSSESASKKRHPGFRKPLLPPADSQIEDDGDEESPVARKGSGRSLSDIAQSVLRHQYRPPAKASDKAREVGAPKAMPIHPERNELKQSQLSGDESDSSEPQMPSALESAAKKKSHETNKRFHEQLRQQEDEWTEMTRNSSSPAPQSLTPMIPGSKLKSALKSSWTSDIAKATEPRRTVSFDEAHSPLPDSNQPAVRFLRSVANPTPSTPQPASSSRASYYESLFNQVSSSPLPPKPAQDSTPSIPKASRARVYPPKENKKPKGLGAAGTESKHEDQAVSIPKNKTAQTAESRSSPSTKLRTPRGVNGVLEIKGDNIRMSASKESPKPGRKEIVASGPESESQDATSAEAKSGSRLQSEDESGADEDLGPEAGGTSRQSKFDALKSQDAGKVNESAAQRSVSLGADSESCRRIPAAKMVLPTAASATIPAAGDSKDREDERSDSEPRSPARQVASSSESESEPGSDPDYDSESETASEPESKAEPSSITPTVTSPKQNHPARSDLVEPKSELDESESETSSSGSESDSSSGSESESPEEDKSKAARGSADSNKVADNHKPTEKLRTAPVQSQQVKTPAKSPATPLTPAQSNHVSFSALRHKSLSESAKSKLSARKKPVSKTPPARAIPANSDTSESDDESDSSEENRKPLKKKQKPATYFEDLISTLWNPKSS